MSTVWFFLDTLCISILADPDPAPVFLKVMGSNPGYFLKGRIPSICARIRFQDRTIFSPALCCSCNDIEPNHKKNIKFWFGAKTEELVI